MTRREPSITECVNRTAAAEILGVKPQTIDKIRERQRKLGGVPFPEPVARPGRKSPLWRRVEIISYGRATGRLD